MKILILGSSLTLAFMVAAPMKLQAEETVKVSFEKRNFDSKINSWVEGTIMSIDADAGRMGVRGSKRAYASAYAEMLQDIDAKTDGLNDTDRRAKAQEIRQKWATQLDAAREKKAEKEGDYTFYLPEKGKSLKISDESSTFDLENKPITPPVNVKTSEREQAAILAFKDLKIGERILVGFESGVIYNNAYVVIKTSSNKTDIAQDAVLPIGPATAVVDAPVVRRADGKIDNEMLAMIRRDIVEDKNLSTMAHNVTLQRDNDTLTLKGTVESDAEKMAVEKKVAQYVGSTRVVSQLDVGKK